MLIKYFCKCKLFVLVQVIIRSLRKNLEAVPGKHSIDSLQKTAILGTSHIIWKVLQCESWSLSGGDHRWFKRSTGKKRLVTRDIHIYNNNNNNSSNTECRLVIVHNNYTVYFQNLWSTNKRFSRIGRMHACKPTLQGKSLCE